MSSKTYDILKWIDVKLLPALNILLIGLAELLNIPVLVIVAGVVALIQKFLGDIMCKSSKDYFADKEIVPSTMGAYGDGSDGDE